MFWSGDSSLVLVGRDSICGHCQTSNAHKTCNHCTSDAIYHFDRRIGQVDELGEHLSVLPRRVQLGGIPEGQHSADQLSEAFGPRPIRVWLSTCTWTPQSATTASLRTMRGLPTDVLVVQLQKVPLLVQLVRVAIQQGKNGLQ